MRAVLHSFRNLRTYCIDKWKSWPSKSSPRYRNIRISKGRLRNIFDAGYWGYWNQWNHFWDFYSLNPTEGCCISQTNLYFYLEFKNKILKVCTLKMTSILVSSWSRSRIKWSEKISRWQESDGWWHFECLQISIFTLDVRRPVHVSWSHDMTQILFAESEVKTFFPDASKYDLTYIYI